jgi:hypothetical protein
MGEDESGHIAAHTNEGILFFDSKISIRTFEFWNDMTHLLQIYFP